jgi:hypothetical protein
MDAPPEPRVERKTEPLIVAPVVIPPAPEPPPPPSSRLSEVPVARTTNPAVIVGVFLAVAAMLLLAGVLLMHLRDRTGKPSEKGSLALPSFADAQAGAAPTTLSPGAVVVPSAAPADPIAPLQPSPAKSAPTSR